MGYISHICTYLCTYCVYMRTYVFTTYLCLYHFTYINMYIYSSKDIEIFSKYLYFIKCSNHSPTTFLKKHNIDFQKLPGEVQLLLNVRFSVSCVGRLGLGGQHTVLEPSLSHFCRVRRWGVEGVEHTQGVWRLCADAAPSHTKDLGIPGFGHPQGSRRSP